MRVFELAKIVQTSSSEVLQQADALGIEAYSPLTQLDAQDATRLQDVFKQRPAADVERENAERAARRAEKMAFDLSRRAAQEKADLAVLEANRQRALEMDARAKGLPSVPSAAPAAVASAPAPAEAPAPAAAAVAPAPAAAPAPDRKSTRLNSSH